jgi:hypothetical protein
MIEGHHEIALVVVRLLFQKVRDPRRFHMQSTEGFTVAERVGMYGISMALDRSQ